MDGKKKIKPVRFVVGVPVCPEYLSGIGKQEFDRIVRMMKELGQAHEGDNRLLGTYCVIYERWVKAITKLSTEEFYVESSNGYKATNPLVSISQQCEKQMVTLLKELGLTPRSRQEVRQVSRPFSEVDSFFADGEDAGG